MKLEHDVTSSQCETTLARKALLLSRISLLAIASALMPFGFGELDGIFDVPTAWGQEGGDADDATEGDTDDAAEGDADDATEGSDDAGAGTASLQIAGLEMQRSGPVPVGPRS